MTAHAEEIEYGALDREKPLRVRGGLEPAHLALPLPGWLVGDFCAVVHVLICTVDHRRHHGPVRRGVAAQLVRNQLSRDAALAFQ